MFHVKHRKDIAMGSILDFSHKLKELQMLVRNLNNSNDELSRALAITKAQIILSEYRYDINKLDGYSTSQFCTALIALLNKLE